MLQKLITIAIIAAAGYWYWQGPYQESINPSQATETKTNRENMDRCTRAKAYKLGATGTGVDAETAKTQCAEEFNVYWEAGNWHRYDRVMPGDR